MFFQFFKIFFLVSLNANLQYVYADKNKQTKNHSAIEKTSSCFFEGKFGQYLYYYIFFKLKYVYIYLFFIFFLTRYFPKTSFTLNLPSCALICPWRECGSVSEQVHAQHNLVYSPK